MKREKMYKKHSVYLQAHTWCTLLLLSDVPESLAVLSTGLDTGREGRETDIRFTQPKTFSQPAKTRREDPKRKKTTGNKFPKKII